MPEGRLNIFMQPSEAAFALTGGSAGPIRVLAMMAGRYHGIELFALFNILDSKRLYDEHIWELFQACGQDLARFVYHLAVELPNQETGVLPGPTGPYAPDSSEIGAFMAARQYGRPGSFWALQNPPTSPYYDWPIRP